MKDERRPEERLKELRARAHEVKAQLERKIEPPAPAEMQRELALDSPVESPDDYSRNLLERDRMTMFLRTLKSRLHDALDELRASSSDLDQLAQEIDRIEKERKNRKVNQ